MAVDGRRRDFILGSAALGAALLSVNAAFAHKVERPRVARAKHQGMLQELEDLRLELVVDPDRLTLYARDRRDRPLALDADGCQLTLWSKDGARTLNIQSREGHLEARAALPQDAPFRVIVRLALAGREPLSTHFGPIALPLEPQRGDQAGLKRSAFRTRRG